MADIKERTIQVAGYDVNVVIYSYASYYYPAFNGNAEFKVSAKGFRDLSHYLRIVRWAQSMMPDFYA